MEKDFEHAVCIPTVVNIDGEIADGIIVTLIDDEGNIVQHPFRATQGVVHVLEGLHKDK